MAAALAEAEGLAEAAAPEAAGLAEAAPPAAGLALAAVPAAGLAPAPVLPAAAGFEAAALAGAALGEVAGALEAGAAALPPQALSSRQMLARRLTRELFMSANSKLPARLAALGFLEHSPCSTNSTPSRRATT